jgi:hypothetical protein
MILVADYNDFGIEKTILGEQWVIVAKAPGPYALAFKKSDQLPATLHIINLQEKNAVVLPGK